MNSSSPSSNCRECGYKLRTEAAVCLNCGAVVPNCGLEPRSREQLSVRPPPGIQHAASMAVPGADALTWQPVDPRLWQVSVTQTLPRATRNVAFTLRDFMLGLFGQAQISGVVVEEFELSQMTRQPGRLGLVMSVVALLGFLTWLWSAPWDVGLSVLLIVFSVCMLLLRFGLRLFTVMMFFSRDRARPVIWERTLLIERADGRGQVMTTVMVPETEQSRLKVLTPRSRIEARGRWCFSWNKDYYPEFRSWRKFNRTRSPS